MKSETITSTSASLPLLTSTSNKVEQPISLSSASTASIGMVATPPPYDQIAISQNGSPILFGSGIALLGVVLTIFFGLWKTKKELEAAELRMRTELMHAATSANLDRQQSINEANASRQYDAEQAHQERITKARREAYLELIDEIVKTQIDLSLLPMRGLDGLIEYTGKPRLNAALAKITILGEMSTVRMCRELQSLILEANNRMFVRIPNVFEYKNEGECYDKEVNEQQIEVARLDRELGSHIRNQTNLNADFSNLKYEREARLKKIAELANAAANAKKLFVEAQLEYHQFVLVETKVITHKFDEVVHAIRQELGLTSSIEQLRVTTAAMHMAAESSLQSIKEHVDTSVST